MISPVATRPRVGFVSCFAGAGGLSLTVGLLLMVSILLGGCSTPGVRHAYHGPQLPDDQTVLITTAEPVTIVQVDDHVYKRGVESVRVLPGKHRVYCYGEADGGSVYGGIIGASSGSIGFILPFAGVSIESEGVASPAIATP